MPRDEERNNVGTQDTSGVSLSSENRESTRRNVGAQAADFSWFKGDPDQRYVDEVYPILLKRAKLDE